MAQERKALDANAYALMLLLTALCGVLFLREPLSGTFALAAVLVAAGIVLVNLRR